MEYAGLNYLIGGLTLLISAAIVVNIVKRMGSSASTVKSNGKSNKVIANQSSSVKSGKASNRHIYPGGKLMVYFGSQTGTAEGYARTIVADGKKNGFDAVIADLEDFDPEVLLNAHLALFLVATYGEGEATDNAEKFGKWVENKSNSLVPDYLNNVSYAVFGLGNKQYEHFNQMGKTTDANLAKLGASRLMEIGLGDDDNSMEEDFLAWRTKIWPVLKAKFIPDTESTPAVAGTDCGTQDRVTRVFEAVPCSLRASKQFSPAVDMNKSTNYFFTHLTLPVLVNKELRDNVEGGSTRHIEFDLSNTDLSYVTADNLAVLPENNIQYVENLCHHLNIDPDMCFEIRPLEKDTQGDDGNGTGTTSPIIDETYNNISSSSSSKGFRHTFPTPCTVREAFCRYLDLTAVPTLSLLQSLVPYIEDKEQKAVMMKNLESNERETFRKYLKLKGLSLFAMMTPSGDLSSCRPCLTDLLHLVPTLQPRYYTISSSSSVHPKHVHITVRLSQTAVEELGGRGAGEVLGTSSNTTKSRIVQGVCSAHLQRLTVGSVCKVFFRASSFRLPKSINTPIIMIGPGTGIAPMRALLQEREFQRRSASGSSSGSGGRNTLYFGCQRSDQDYIYKEELADYLDRGTLNELHVAFSRQTGTPKVYVQQLLITQGKTVCEDILDNDGYVYVCGGTAMGTDISEAFVNIIQTNRGISKEQAVAEFKALQQSGKYVQELWTA